VRALVVSNMLPDRDHPERGQFVRDQVAGLCRLGDLEVELCEFPPGAAGLVHGARTLRARHAHDRFDVVHAHFSLSAWPALAARARVRALTVHGTDARHPRTRLATRAVLPLMQIVAAVSESLVADLPGRRTRQRAQVLPCGVDTERFTPLARAQCRLQLGLGAHQRLLLFPADPARASKRVDRAQELARRVQATLLTLGGVDPARVPLLVNAADAVIAPFEREGFGLAVLEALACDVPVLATPVGVHPSALAGVDGALCAPFDLDRWGTALQPHLRDADARVEGRVRALSWSATAMAERVLGAWRTALSK
jgi:glycosyltransferase involved in cell wall biosynthesis